MELVKPDEKYKNSFIRALKEGFVLGSQPPMSEMAIADIETNFDSYLVNKIFKPYDPTPKLRDDGNYYPNAPQLSYWLVDNGEFIGAFNLRTELNGFLMYIGGNVGYGITPRYRRRGYATKGLALLIDEARILNISKLLIAAREDNVGSWKAIEKNGGVLENIIELPWQNDGIKYKRYWINVVIKEKE